MARNQVPGDHKEDIDPHEAARQPLGPQVEEDDQGDRERTHPLNLGHERAWLDPRRWRLDNGVQWSYRLGDGGEWAGRDGPGYRMLAEGLTMRRYISARSRNGTKRYNPRTAMLRANCVVVVNPERHMRHCRRSSLRSMSAPPRRP